MSRLHSSSHTPFKLMWNVLLAFQTLLKYENSYISIMPKYLYHKINTNSVYLPYKVKNKAESFSKSHFSSSWLLVDLRNLLPSTDRWAFIDSWGSSVIVATAPCSISSLLKAQGTLQRLQTSHIRNNHISPCRKTRNENHEYVCVTHQNSEFFTCQNIMAAD